MRKKEVSYSKKTIVRLIWTGILVAGVIILTMGTVCFAGRLSMKVKAGLLVFDCILFAVYFAEVYRDMYRPWCELEKIVHERKDRKTETLADANIAQRDLIKEIQEIISSLENITIRQKNSEILMKVAEINNLQDQINPHFLYNTLDAIAWMCEAGRNEDAVEMVNALARLFRISISRGHELIPIEKELQHAQSYLHIQNFRYKNQFRYQFDVDEACLSYYCNKITLQPIIENAIYHGMDRMVDEGMIRISIHQSEDKIIFTVEDNGVGMTEEQCEEVLKKERSDRAGIGIKNVNDRIKIYFGEEYGLTIKSELDEGTCVTIMMPKVTEGSYEDK